jgi:pimeloyl-ACP methyl ester carboxylesterase
MPHSGRMATALLCAALAALMLMPQARAQTAVSTNAPVLSEELPAGQESFSSKDPIGAVPKIVDGDVSDWVGTITRYGGTAVYSGGEYVYQDHLFDALGPDDGRDASRFERTDPLEDAVPSLYRIDGLASADATGELGIPAPEQFSYDDTYGDADSHVDAADLEEVRVATDADSLYLLARTTTMSSPSQTGLLLLADTAPGSESRPVPYNSNISSTSADVAIFLSAAGGRVTDLVTGAETALDPGSVAIDPSGFRNAIEARVPLSLVAGDGLSLALATGPSNAEGTGFAHLTMETTAGDAAPHANLANVAFRTDEPVRVWFEKDQALALHSGTIDPFFTEIDLAKLADGTGESYEPGPGYHDRIFVSTDQVATEGGRNGLFQHYGVYLPAAYDGSPAPLQWWLHWRGGNAHSAATQIPEMFRQFGEDYDTIVVSPSGRGTSRWYVGKGHVDVLQVWADVFDTFAIDENSVYVTGHSMGGWGSFLMTVLYPDRFAAGVPVSPPVTQGAWTGLDFPQCDQFSAGEETPCYIAANGSRPRDQHTRRMLDNLRWVPLAIYTGAEDELVPYSGVLRQQEKLIELGYRHRMYTLPAGEHYTPPILDEWASVAAYEHGFVRPENPPRVTYRRDMPFELATEQVQSDAPSGQLPPWNFDFDSAYWMSELTPANLQTGVAVFDGSSLAIPEEPFITAPDADAPVALGQTGPLISTGLQWLDNPASSAPAAQNGFDLTLSGATAVRLDLARMDIDVTQPVTGTVTTELPLDLRLDGGWRSAPSVTVDGEPVQVSLDAGVLSIPAPAGTHSLALEAGDTDPSESPTPTATPTPSEVTTELNFTPSSAATGQHSDATRFEARLTDGAGAAIPGAEVTFELVGAESARTLSATTDDAGIAVVTPTLDEKPGSYQLVARYAGESDRYLPDAEPAGFVVAKDDSSLALSVTGNGSKRTARATLTDQDSVGGLAGRTVAFFVDGQQVGTAVTDAAGVATLGSGSAKLAGKHEVTARFDGDDVYLGSADNAST